MSRIKFTSHLRRFFPDLDEIVIEADTVAEIVVALDRRYPGLRDYLVDEQGSLRKHVNIFIGESLVSDRKSLQDAVDSNDEIFVMQALSGG